jgi:hypothetical protein
MFALLGAATSVFLAQTSSKQAQTVRLSLHCRDRPRNQQMWQTSKPKQRLLISSIDEKPDGRISCADGRSQISVTLSDQNINRISIGSTSPLSISFIHFAFSCSFPERGQVQSTHVEYVKLKTRMPLLLSNHPNSIVHICNHHANGKDPTSS